MMVTRVRKGILTHLPWHWKVCGSGLLRVDAKTWEPELTIGSAGWQAEVDARPMEES